MTQATEERYHILASVAYRKEKIFKRGEVCEISPEDVPPEILARWVKNGIVEGADARMDREVSEAAAVEMAIEEEEARAEEETQDDLEELGFVEDGDGDEGG